MTLRVSLENYFALCLLLKYLFSDHDYWIPEKVYGQDVSNLFRPMTA